ncbi:2-C-methyl-D-erythritol 2,4-cyclodiphosphate synthase [Dehalogenimonas etheniformans]|uniref:2-C-methyl-D-erythritol 2,4-cyclodiphosphate synthase n=1 Tax=Dehalogenimonas etheniformans TaxID=1536648 RepID=A0A2P5P7Q8_9CHLR|nr:2-C-methyl-D-erythritol 2,4-cyclodiphosphate synthase [Dehalogenimonas etheniformans]PPD58324.1 2-C-methyl-D-erythritol 2,4-cyclodiphosphate synthase [Dehalogenimonas etheniformans]QNT77084.1 2-C-methyl-D-erythritol 2,4-cyclodiphosphate synthase [Dehalogenimonas etheniformans]
MKTGIGYDVHRLAPNQKLVLGGVEIPWSHGLIGWSDADVLIHAVMDALLGAAGLGDIGVHFPPGDPQYKGISSLKLLAKVNGMLNAGGWKVGNVDAVIVAEQPKLRPNVAAMCQNIASALGLDPSSINVKASTSEELGFVGREEGMVAWATALIER